MTRAWSAAWTSSGRSSPIIGEVDGAEKYTDPAVLLAQGQREWRLRALGYIVVRWTWAELWDRTMIRRIRATIRAARAA